MYLVEAEVELEVLQIIHEWIEVIDDEQELYVDVQKLIDDFEYDEQHEALHFDMLFNVHEVVDEVYDDIDDLLKIKLDVFVEHTECADDHELQHVFDEHYCVFDDEAEGDILHTRQLNYHDLRLMYEKIIDDE